MAWSDYATKYELAGVPAPSDLPEETHDAQQRRVGSVIRQRAA